MKETNLSNSKEQYELDNISEPNLYRQMYPYTELPSVEFESDAPPLAPAEKMWITDTTFRDGQQARPPYPVEHIVDLFKLISKLDGGSGLIRQSEFFLYSEKDRKAVEQCRELGLEFLKLRAGSGR